MSTITVGNLKDLIAIYMGKSSASDLTINSFDVGMYALNAARRKAERLADFVYAEDDAALSIASSGTLITAATGLGTGEAVKRVTGVDLPVSGDYITIEFLTDKEWGSRIQRQIGRQTYSSGSTLAQLGVSNGNPIAYQKGQKIYLVPASQFSFPVSARISVIKFLADYDANGDTDFFTQFAPEYLQWQAILEANKYFLRFSERQEGNIDEKAVGAMAEEALQTLLLWNASLVSDTSTPPETSKAPAQPPK